MPEEPQFVLPESMKRRLVGALAGALLGLVVRYGLLPETSVSSDLVNDLSDALVMFFSFVGYGLSHKWLKRRKFTPSPPPREHVTSPSGEFVQCWCGDYHMTVVVAKTIPTL